MKREIWSCDVCGLDTPVTVLNCSVDVCTPCLLMILNQWLQHATLRTDCRRCEGSGKVRGKRTDSPNCGESRPEYERLPCPDCGPTQNVWRKKAAAERDR